MHARATNWLRWGRRQPWALWALGGLLGLGLVVPVAAMWLQGEPEEFGSPYLRIDPDKIVLDNRDSRIPCGECHNLEYEVWTETKHATGFDRLHRSDRSQAILERMDFRRSKAESLCLKCHYTAKEIGDQVRAIAGVSCESCHGAARDWVNVHQDYGGATHDTESAEHRAMRIAQSQEGGMLRPSTDLYAVAANCFECHTVPEEELVNVGGHASGSSNFELISRIDEIQHNFLPAQWGGSEENREPSAERKRLMYVIGRALDYEYSIRAAARATDSGTYAKAMERRVKNASRELEKILRVAEIPAVASALRIGSDVDVVPNNRRALLAAADEISEETQAFAQENDGTALIALDPLVRGEPVAAADPGGSEAEPLLADAGTDAGNPYERRARPEWFPVLDVATLPPGGCSCHGPGDTVSPIDKLAWHENDAHSQTAQPLLTETARAVQIAELYGLTPAQMKRGDQLCMNCHGTVVTGNETFEVEDGVSCQGCHGAAGEYQFQHQNGGYEQGGEHGLIELEDASLRATTCATCHHITDERLLAAGHSTGESFEIGQRNGRIQHWAGPALGAAELETAYTAAREARPVPEVERATAPAPTVALAAVSEPEPEPEPEEPLVASAETLPPVAEVRIVGERRRQPDWFPRLSQSTLAPLQNCGCHGDALRWHQGDAHSAAADPILNNAPRAVRIAELYGISASQMKQGNQLCMSCHGSVETGQESEQVFDGVGCQSCHGPASEYLASHSREGYEGSASKGMVQLETLSARATTCARCHHITDERLLSAGHSDGGSFQLGSRNAAIAHWEGPEFGAGNLNAAYASAIGGRPVPAVERAALPEPIAVVPRRRSGGQRAGSPAAQPSLPRTRPVDRFAELSSSGVNLSPAPEVTDSTSTETILLIAKQRLERLYRALRGDE